MIRAKLNAGSVEQYPYPLVQIREDFPNVSFPENLESCDLSVFGVVNVEFTAQPEVDHMTHNVVEGDPIFDGQNWRQQWSVVELTQEQIAENRLRDEKIVSDKTEQLWAAANAYTTGYISGVAIGILTIGVIQLKPKCLAVSLWSKLIWDEYYVRKSAITPKSDLDFDFSKFGPIPYSVPELSEEVQIVS